MPRPRPSPKVIAQTIANDVDNVIRCDIPRACESSVESWYGFTVLIRDGYATDMDIEFGSNTSITTHPITGCLDDDITTFVTTFSELTESRCVTGFHGRVYAKLTVGNTLTTEIRAVQRRQYKWADKKPFHGRQLATERFT